MVAERKEKGEVTEGKSATTAQTKAAMLDLDQTPDEPD